MPLELDKSLGKLDELLAINKELKLRLSLTERHLADMRKIALGTVGEVKLDEEDKILMAPMPQDAVPTPQSVPTPHRQPPPPPPPPLSRPHLYEPCTSPYGGPTACPESNQQSLR